jgi:hypothetical protein
LVVAFSSTKPKPKKYISLIMPIQRKPNLGEANWGQILNDYLTVSHDTDGSIRTWADAASRPASPDPGATGMNLATGKVEKFNGTVWIETTTTKLQQLKYDRGVPNAVSIDAQEWLNQTVSATEFGLNTTRRDNQVAINAAIDYVVSTFDGGTVHIPNGTFKISGPIIMKEKVRIMGQSNGMGFGTQLSLANNSNTNMIEFDQTKPTRWCGIENIMLDCNRFNNTTGHGIYLFYPDLSSFYPYSVDCYHTFRNLRIEHAAQDGIHIDGAGSLTFTNSGTTYTDYFNVRSCHFANILSRDHNGAGYNMIKISDSTFFDIIAYSCGKQGFTTNGANLHVYYLKTYYNNKTNIGQAGMDFNGSKRLTLLGLEPQEEYWNGAKIENCQDVNIIGGIFDANGRPVGTAMPSGTATPGIGLIIKNSNHINCSSLIFTSFHTPSWQDVGFTLEGTSQVNILGTTSQNQLTADYQLIGTANVDLVLELNGKFKETTKMEKIDATTVQLSSGLQRTNAIFSAFDGGATFDDAVLDINMTPKIVAPATSSTAAASVRFFRNTITSGIPVVSILKGDGSNTPNFILAGKGNSGINMNSGNVGLGGSGAPSEKLHVFGNIRADGTMRFGTGTNTYTLLNAFDGGTSTNSAILDINPIPKIVSPALQSIEPADIRFFRGTNTSANSSVSIFKGDNTSTTNIRLSGNGNTNLNMDNGNVSVGGGTTVNATEKLHVFGNMKSDGGDYNNGHIILGAYHLWVGTDGKLRVKNGIPATSLDGTVVGAQV